MRKYFVFMFILLISGCTNSVNKTEFINPIFNQPLRPLSDGNGYTYITPTSIDMRIPKDKNLVAGKGECELIENTQERITLKCKYKWIPSDGELWYVDTHLKSSIPFEQKTAQQIIDIYSKTYEKYFTYYIERLLFDNCLVIKEEIINVGENQVSSISSYCVTPPNNYKSKSD